MHLNYDKIILQSDHICVTLQCAPESRDLLKMGRKKYKQAVRSTSLNKSQEQSLKIKSNISSIKDEVSNEDRKESSEDLCTNNMIPNETNNEDDQGSAVQLEAPKSDLSNIISTPLYRTVDLETQGMIIFCF